MKSITDYAQLQNLEHIIVNDLAERLTYLNAIKAEMIVDLIELESRIDDIVDDMREAGIDVDRNITRP